MKPPTKWLIISIFVGFSISLLPLEWAFLVTLATITTLFGAMSPLITLSLLLILSPLRTLIATEASYNLPIEIGQFFFIILVLFNSKIAVLSHLRLKLLLSHQVISSFIFLIAISLSVPFALSFNVALTEWLKWVTIFFMMYWLSQWVTEENVESVLLIVLLSAFANAVVGIYIFLGGSGADHLLINDRFFRAFGTFGQPNPFGGFMGMTLPIGIVILFLVTSRLSKDKMLFTIASFIGMGILVVILLLALIMSWSRGAWIAFAVATLAMVFALPRRTLNSFLVLSFTITLSWIVWQSGLLPASIQARVESSIQDFVVFNDVRGIEITPENYAVIERLAHWQSALAMAESYPLLGVGIGNYAVAYPTFRLLNWIEPLGHAHNYYLNIWAEAGMIGLLSYIIFIGSVFVTIWQLRNHPSRKIQKIAIGLLGFWTYLFTHHLLDNLYVNNLFLHLGTLLGVVLALNNRLSNTYILE